MFTCTKHYPASLGLSCVFRQPGATSHCRHLHGYALAVTLEFGCTKLDTNGWVLDFGALKPVKSWLVEMFDHTLLVSSSDPSAAELVALGDAGLADVRVVRRVGCEAFAEMIGHYVETFLFDIDVADRVALLKATVHEHDGNSASYLSGRGFQGKN